MKTRDAIKHFSPHGKADRAGRVALAAALKIRAQSTYGWGYRVPALRQLQLEDATQGALMADPKLKPQISQ